MKDIVIVPIREHSKGVRNKNIYRFENNLTSLEMIKIQFMKLDHQFDFFVNTESQLLKIYAQSIGIDVLDRPNNLSADNATLDDVVNDILKKDFLKNYLNLWIIQATCPLISYNSLLIAKAKLDSDKTIDTVFSAKSVKGFLWKNQGNDYQKQYKDRLNRQEQKNLFIAESGAITISRISKLVKTKNRFKGMKCKPVILPNHENIDIDEYIDIEKVNLHLKKKKGKVVFITNGDENIGSGHIYRTITLASEINSFEKLIFFKKNKLSESIFSNYQYQFFNYDSIQDVIREISKFKIKSIVIDKLETNREDFIKLKKLDCPIISLEDYGDPAIFYSDIVINSLYETSINISKLFSGYKYEVIRPDVKAFSTLPKKKIINTSTYNLLICFGGTDPNKFMFRIPSILDILNDNLNGKEKLNVKLIYSIGEDNKVDNMIKNYDKLNVFSLSHTSVIAKELYESDIILCGNGRMIYEATLLNNIVISIPQNSRESTHTFCRDMPGHKQLPVFSEVTDDEIVSGILDSLELLKSDNDDLKDKIRMQIINEIKNGTSRVLELIDNV